MQKTYQHLLKPLEALFDKNYTEQQVMEFAKDCEHYPPEELAAAARMLREKSYLPKLGEILAALREVSGGRRASFSASALHKRRQAQQEGWAEAHRRAENWLRDAPLAAQAQQEGWFSLGPLGGLGFWVHRLCHAQAREVPALSADLCPEHLLCPADPSGAWGRRRQVAGILRSGEISVPGWLIDAWRPLVQMRPPRTK